nr:MarC family protein [Desulfobulbaceae bacterium]
MNEVMYEFWICFVPLFVAVDAIGILPLFISLTNDLETQRRRYIILQSVFTAAPVALLFLFTGPTLLVFLGVAIPDFMIAGGILLLTISLGDLLTGEKRQRKPDPESLGAVPIGIPLITGPAVLTTCILLASTHGNLVTASATIANIAIAGIVFWFSEPLTKWLGRTGTRIVSKVASLLLVAIAIMLIRKGVFETITNFISTVPSP